ncbi:hypothetical protein HK100_001372 [Physocladia obscura]|uniref:Uncharacterized protein n=1 Tax=Physocladia obscura TaxID=109957 RepID=A0AAD5XB34_9FUNG|nr:hypothetical protein HK100_001372 [Physocladia obscura]
MSQQQNTNKESGGGNPPAQLTALISMQLFLRQAWIENGASHAQIEAKWRQLNAETRRAIVKTVAPNVPDSRENAFVFIDGKNVDMSQFAAMFPELCITIFTAGDQLFKILTGLTEAGTLSDVASKHLAGIRMAITQGAINIDFNAMPKTDPSILVNISADNAFGRVERLLPDQILQNPSTPKQIIEENAHILDRQIKGLSIATWEFEMLVTRLKFLIEQTFLVVKELLKDPIAEKSRVEQALPPTVATPSKSITTPTKTIKNSRGCWSCGKHACPDGSKDKMFSFLQKQTGINFGFSDSDDAEDAVKRLHEISINGDYELKPLDAVLFAGSDPVAGFIKKIELHEVVPRIQRPFHELWTHAGILVNKSVLPLDCLEDGKMYLYESVFSGKVAGYVYSTILPVDHPVPKDSFHLGPQIRDFEAVVAEGDADVGICPLTKSQREFLEAKFSANPNLLLDLYHQYHDFGYPITNILPVIASASQPLYADLQYFNKISLEFFPHKEKKKVVFCSELVSIIYREIGHKSFSTSSPDTFTPLAVEVVPEFGSIVFYAKENKTMRLKNGKISADPHTTRTLSLLQSQKYHKNWISMPPGGGVPANAEQAGTDTDGTKLYVARVKIGSAWRLGKIREGDKTPFVAYFDREVRINYGHEVLATLSDTVWVEAEGGHVPSRAVEAGIEEDGTPFYVARAIVGESNGFLGFEHHAGVYAPGAVAKNLGSARIPFNGVEVKAPKYEVLCHSD